MPRPTPRATRLCRSLSIGVKPAGGAPCCFQRSESTYDSTERVHDAKRQCVFWCWQVYDGKRTAAGERLTQSIDRAFSHVGRFHVDMACGLSRERTGGGSRDRSNESHNEKEPTRTLTLRAW